MARVECFSCEGEGDAFSAVLGRSVNCPVCGGGGKVELNYVVKLTLPEVFLGPNHHWVDRVQDAEKFETEAEATTAMGAYTGTIMEYIR